jgi:hypothetical protein
MLKGSHKGSKRGSQCREMAMTEHRSENQLVSSSIEELLTVAAVALILHLSPKMVNKLAREGKLGCVQVTSRERRFTCEQVQQYIQSCSTSVRVDKKAAPAVSSRLKKGGDRAQSVGVNGKDLREEMRQWR